MFFSFDGIDGTGKSTQMDLFIEWLGGRGYEVVACRDPGGTPLGERLREILLRKSGMSMCRRAEMFLYMASRAQLVQQVIRPSLDAGKTVVSDRYLLANVAYQGYTGEVDADDVWRVGDVAVEDVKPTTVFLLDMPVEDAIRRLNRVHDRMEAQGRDFMEKVRQGFLTEADRRSEIIVIDAARSIDSIQADIRRKAERRFGLDENQTMTWAGVEGHDHIVEQFRHALRAGRLASTFLFVGPAGIGKRLFAVKLAQSLLCERHPEENLDPCGRCPACQQVDALSHPDLEVVSKPKDKSFIPIELFIGDREHRMREGLCHRIALKPFRGGRKVAIIDDADFLNQEGANCLLKTLEEPPPKSMITLIGTSEQKQLPTIRSRCQVVRFRPLPEETVAQLLVSQGLVDDADQAANLACLSGGSLQRALESADEQMREFREMLLTELSRPNWDSVQLSKTVGQFVDEAGKEAPPRRARMKRLIGFAAQFYRHLMRSLSGGTVHGDAALERAVSAARSTWSGDAETAAACLERCLDAEGHVLANANQATLLECWLDELATMTHKGCPL